MKNDAKWILLCVLVVILLISHKISQLEDRIIEIEYSTNAHSETITNIESDVKEVQSQAEENESHIDAVNDRVDTICRGKC